MNANDISPKTGSRLNRIQKVSAFLRIIFFVSAVTFGLIGILGYGVAITEAHPPLSFYLNFSSLGHAVECWFAYKLFSCYVGGDLFTSNVVRCIRWIGIASLLMGVGSIFNTLLLRLHDGYFEHIRASSLTVGVIACLQLIFFQLVHNLVSGFVIIFVAWIMDEGRKIQEEQELTV